MERIVIFGAGSLAETIAYHINNHSEDEVVAFTADSAYIQCPELSGLPVVPFESLNETYPPEQFKVIVVVGFRRGSNQWLLEIKSTEAKKKGYSLYTYIDPRAYVADNVKYGENCIFAPGCFVEPFVTIGHGVIFRSRAYIGHHSKVGDYCFIAPNASTSSFVDIGSRVFLGNNSIIRDNVRIGEQAVVGAGAVVLDDIEPEAIYKASVGTILTIDRSNVKI